MAKLRKVFGVVGMLIAVVVGFLVISLVINVLILVYNVRHPPSPEVRFRQLFSDMTIEAPTYQTLQEMTYPPDTIKGDYCILTFTQSESQFHRFATNLGVSEQKLLSSSSDWIRVNTKLEPRYPWFLDVSAQATNLPEKTYLVHIEGRQPDNR